MGIDGAKTTRQRRKRTKGIRGRKISVKILLVLYFSDIYWSSLSVRQRSVSRVSKDEGGGNEMVQSGSQAEEVNLDHKVARR